jgi:hypothetical protein
MLTLGVMSPASIGPHGERFAQSTWLLACSFHGNFGLATTAAVSDLHPLGHSKLLMEIDHVTVMVVPLAATAQLMSTDNNEHPPSRPS